MKTTMDWSKSDISKLTALKKKSPAAFKKGMERGAIQLITWMNNGSPKESAKPPILTGFLRGTSSAFVGSKLVSVGPVKSTGETPAPLRTYSAKDDTITVIYNATYAARMHEWRGEWGEYTLQDGDAGNKWIEKHLKADKELLLDVIGLEVKKELGL